MIVVVGRLLIVLIAIGFFWQVLLPVLTDRPVFPLFRREKDAQARLEKAERRKREAERRLEAAELETEAEKLETQARERATRSDNN